MEALAVYGTLRPGQPNHWVVRSIKGDWFPGTITGYEFEITWGPADGYPGVIPDADGLPISVDVLIADDLDKHWRDIDDFEGAGYRRVMCNVTLDDGRMIDAQIYEALSDAE